MAAALTFASVTTGVEWIPSRCGKRCDLAGARGSEIAEDWADSAWGCQTHHLAKRAVSRSTHGSRMGRALHTTPSDQRLYLLLGERTRRMGETGIYDFFSKTLAAHVPQ